MGRLWSADGADSRTRAYCVCSRCGRGYLDIFFFNSTQERSFLPKVRSFLFASHIFSAKINTGIIIADFEYTRNYARPARIGLVRSGN